MGEERGPENTPHSLQKELVHLSIGGSGWVYARTSFTFSFCLVLLLLLLLLPLLPPPLSPIYLSLMNYLSLGKRATCIWQRPIKYISKREQKWFPVQRNKNNKYGRYKTRNTTKRLLCCSGWPWLALAERALLRPAGLFCWLWLAQAGCLAGSGCLCMAGCSPSGWLVLLGCLIVIKTDAKLTEHRAHRTDGNVLILWYCLQKAAHGEDPLRRKTNWEMYVLRSKQNWDVAGWVLVAGLLAPWLAAGG